MKNRNRSLKIPVLLMVAVFSLVTVVLLQQQASLKVAQVSEKSIKEQFATQMLKQWREQTLKTGDASRELQAVKVDKIKYLAKPKGLLIYYTFAWKPKYITSSACYLFDDGTGHFIGPYIPLSYSVDGIEARKIQLIIKTAN